MVAVAQLVSALDCGSSGWGFKSPLLPHIWRSSPGGLERSPHKRKVEGSSPSSATIFERFIMINIEELKEKGIKCEEIKIEMLHTEEIQEFIKKIQEAHKNTGKSKLRFK